MTSHSLVFDAQTTTTPCFYHADTPDNDEAITEAINMSDNALVDPTTSPINDFLYMNKIQQWQLQPHFARPPLPGTCSVSAPGFVCGPLPAPPGTLVKCVPRMDHSNLNQLAARVLPLTTSRSNSVLDDPSYPDPRFKFFPLSYPPAISRCCGGSLTNPLDVVPPPCHAPNAIYQHVVPNIRAHEVDPMKMGFQKNDRPQLEQMALKNKFDQISSAIPTTRRIDHWESEARLLPNNSLLERIKMMSMDQIEPISFFSRKQSRIGLIKQFL
jgi:hypothetical protein